MNYIRTYVRTLHAYICMQFIHTYIQYIKNTQSNIRSTQEISYY